MVKFAVFLLICIIASPALSAPSLNEESLLALRDVIQYLNNLNAEYQALKDSGRLEANNIARNFNAQQLSRTGSVFQEIKDLEYELVNEIDAQSWLFENPDCFAAARSWLQNSSDIAGTRSMGAYNDIIERSYAVRYTLVDTVLLEIGRNIPIWAVEPLAFFTVRNSVTELDSLLLNLLVQISEYRDQFEQFVDELISEMRSLENYNNSLSLIIAEALEATRLTFISEAEAIRSFVDFECSIVIVPIEA